MTDQPTPEQLDPAGGARGWAPDRETVAKFIFACSEMDWSTALEGADAILALSPPQEPSWVRYDGKGRPFPNGTPLEIKQRNGMLRRGAYWSEITWSWSTRWRHEDVIFYRVTPLATSDDQPPETPV